MEEYQKRAAQEELELADRINKLEAFIWTDEFYELASGEQTRLRRQLSHMKDYRSVLRDRIAHF
jgi:hypothetical protein